MERRVKERLIGASILVVLVVLVVPELLSGSKQPPVAPPAVSLPRPASTALEPVRNVTVDLATSKPPSEDADGAGASLAASQAPASAASAPQSQEAEASPPPKAEPRQVTPPASASSTPKYPVPSAPKNVESAAPIPTSSNWSVQLGSFISRGNAESLVQKVKAEGFPAFLSPSGSGKNERFRVRVGQLSDRNAAERMASKLKSARHDGTVVAPGR
jgi:DedD protein